MIGRLLALIAMLGPGSMAARAEAPDLDLERIDDARPLNVVFILSDDHRYDVMSFMGHDFVETPAMDRMAREGVHLANAYVTTSLCSPSRASILTGQYASRHGVVDNQRLEPPGMTYFPQYMQRIGYETALIGKWHMGAEHDRPRPGFDHWVSFAGQGTYYPGPDTTLNINGERVPQRGYITDELTDYAVEWLEGRSGERPFFLYLSHKGVHSNFDPAERHRGRYDGVEINLPIYPPENEDGQPLWLQNQRNTLHGVDYPVGYLYGDLKEFYQKYCEALLSVDESIARVIETLERKGWLEDTVIIYMGDNGFCFGDHGTLDKRHAYEASIRVPKLLLAPGLAPAGHVVEEVVANIDIAPTILEAAGLAAPADMDGASFLPLARGEPIPWREELLYEYYWEWNYPYTPTQFALRTDRWKYIFFWGVYDINGLYDMKNDPLEMNNLIDDPEYAEIGMEMNRRLFELMEEVGATSMHINPTVGGQWRIRNVHGSPAADFPPYYYYEGVAPRTPMTMKRY